ncbi:MAG: SRPBCC family protein [Chloroflexi bacterium]|nr:SRPBCC family protein [Chloroflexota bacterium]
MKTSVTSAIHIDRSPEEIMAVILDPEQAVHWTSGLERFGVVSGKPGDVGSTARLHYREGGRAYVMHDTLLEVDPLRRYVSQVSGEALSARVETSLAREQGGGTRVAVRWTGEGKPFFLRLLLPLMRRSIARQAQADLAKLKQVVETGGQTGPHPSASTT